MNFDAKQLKNEIVAWIRDWFEKNGAGCNAIVGISGGKDSSAVAALCAEALGADRVIGILMPNGEQFDIDMSELLVKHLGIRHRFRGYGGSGRRSGRLVPPEDQLDRACDPDHLGSGTARHR